jgi:hypothetical protein
MTNGKHMPSVVGRWITYTVPGRYRFSSPTVYGGTVLNEAIIAGKRMLFAQGRECQFWAPFDDVVFSRDYGEQIREPLSPETVAALRGKLASGDYPRRKVKRRKP